MPLPDRMQPEGGGPLGAMMERARPRLTVESLEDRRMMAGTPEMMFVGTPCLVVPSALDSDRTYVFGSHSDIQACNHSRLYRTDGKQTVAMDGPSRKFVEFEDHIYYVRTNPFIPLDYLARVSPEHAAEVIFDTSDLPRARIDDLRVVENRIQFSVTPSQGLTTAWETDGTKEGTHRISRLGRWMPQNRAARIDVSISNGLDLVGSIEEVNNHLESKGEKKIRKIEEFFRYRDHLFFVAMRAVFPEDEFQWGVFVVDLYPELTGDVQNDGDVDFDDFLVLSANFGKATDALAEEGDLDQDDDVDFDDFLILAENFGRTLEDR